MSSPLSRGTVTDFDEFVGLGHVTDERGRALLFHCTQISDGSRTIAVGTSVTFHVEPRPNGPEAYAVTPAGLPI